MHSPRRYKVQYGLPFPPLLLIYFILLLLPTFAHNPAHPIHKHKRIPTSQTPDHTTSQPIISHNVSATNAPAHPFRKRDDAQDFRNLVCKGEWLINAVIKRTTLTGNVWKESDLDAAYFWDDEEPFQPSPNILPALQELGIPHGRDEVHYVEINQNVPFKIGGQEYVSSSRNQRPQPQRLHRHGGDAEMDGVHQARAGPDTDFLPWPGQLYDLTMEEGKAMLATAHGVGVAYLVADHSDTLGGKKYPAVCIFTAPARQEDTMRPERNDYYTIWELQDATEYAQMELDRPRKCRDMI
ncbi:MAG: hypothetical protein Q9207_004493 [Kuettlingeria erythrocarpa]